MGFLLGESRAFEILHFSKRRVCFYVDFPIRAIILSLSLPEGNRTGFGLDPSFGSGNGIISQFYSAPLARCIPKVEERDVESEIERSYVHLRDVLIKDACGPIECSSRRSRSDP